MPDKYLYLLVDAMCFIFPFVLSFHKRILFYRQWRYLLLPWLITSALFITWDVIFTSRGVWTFNDRYVLGIYFFGLPLEEFLFFFCIPYACSFTYHCITVLFTVPPGSKTIRVFTGSLGLLLFVAGLFFLPRLYTSTTFLLLSAVLIFLVYKDVSFLTRFYISFLITLIPFYLSNGVLTGALTPEAIVRYNDQYNLGIKTITIPIEDIFYGMALILMNIAGFEYARPKHSNSVLVM